MEEVDDGLLTSGRGGNMVPPLTRFNSKGELLERTEDVSAQIARALSVERGELLNKLTILDYKEPGFLGPECLVFLIRQAFAASDAALLEGLSSALMKRCQRHIRAALSRLDDQEARKEAFSEVTEQLFGTVLDIETDRGDFLQVRFWRALDKMIAKAFSRAVDREKARNSTVDVLDLAGERPGGDDEEDAGGPRVRLTDELLDPGLWPDREAMLKDAMQALSLMRPEIAEAFLLWHYHGWQIEDQDPQVDTISRYFDKTPRTIRLWLKRAEEVLLPWRKRNT